MYSVGSYLAYMYKASATGRAGRAGRAMDVSLSMFIIHVVGVVQYTIHTYRLKFVW